MTSSIIVIAQGGKCHLGFSLDWELAWGEWDNRLGNMILLHADSTRLTLSALACDGLICRCLPLNTTAQLLTFLSQKSLALLPRFFGCWWQYGMGWAGVWIWWASTNRTATERKWNIACSQDFVFPCYYECCNFPFSQLLFTRSLGWNELVGKKVDTCLSRDW